MSRRGNHLIVVVLGIALGAAGPASAGDPPPKKQKKPSALVPDLDLSGLGGTPKAEGLNTRKAGGTALAPKAGAPEVVYEVVEVIHARSFTRTPQGAKPDRALDAIQLYGRPPSTEPFTTLVRVKASKPEDTSIELVILDPRGDTALSGAGRLVFPGEGKGQVDYLLEWAPTPQARTGEFKLLVRIGGQPRGTWPLKVVAEQR